LTGWQNGSIITRPILEFDDDVVMAEILYLVRKEAVNNKSNKALPVQASQSG